MTDKIDNPEQKCSEDNLNRSEVDGASSSISTQEQKSHNGANGEMKKAAAQLIGRYYFQLKEGCGNLSCNNPNCASSGQIGPLTNDEAAGKALQLLSERAKLCKQSDSVSSFKSESSPQRNVFREVKTPNKPPGVSEIDVEMESSPSFAVAANNRSRMFGFSNGNSSCGLTEEKLNSTIEECTKKKNYAGLRILLRSVFSNEAALRFSFLSQKSPNSNASTRKNSPDESKNIDSEIKSLNIRKENITKEELRANECDLDKDVDCLEENSSMEDEMLEVETEVVEDSNKLVNDAPTKDGVSKSFKLHIESVRRAYQSLFQCPENEFVSTLLDAIRQFLKDTLSIHLLLFPQLFTADSSITNIFIILLENPALTSTEFTEDVLGDLCRVLSLLGVKQQAVIVRHLASQWEPSRIHRFLESLHQLITIRLLNTVFSKDYSINDEEAITSATNAMKILFYTSIYGGVLDHPLLKSLPPQESLMLPPHQDHFLGAGKECFSRPPPWDSLGVELGIHTLDARNPLVPFEEFYDDFLSDQLEMDKDFAYYKSGSSAKFSFLNYPFILTPATKALGLYYDNRIRMYSERRMSIYQTIMEGTPTNPYLRLRIRRDHIIDDALVELELVALENPGDLKKQLVVEFEGEQGIDEGGVSKEFFQLIIEQIFNPDYAMFCLNHETETFWFNPTSFESDAQFTLVGVVLGLAIYNNVILDLHFPPVMYKKLCGKPGCFHDLKDWNTTLYKSLLHLLNYEGDDMEDTFVQSFRVGYEDIFGTSLHHDLRPGGNTIFVNQENKQEFVNLYADFLINKSVERQFFAFKRGFYMVTDDSPLQHLFRPLELELLVCGSQHYDFAELRKSTEYDSGYCITTPIIVWFWELVDEMTTEEKKQLLQFTTGSARVPVGGLARLKLIIARHGSDSERLPTAHTCFNVLLLPQYSSKEKLKERLYKAIKYAQGFGML